MPTFLVGTHVKVGTKKGVVRFVGATRFAAGEWYGIELNGPSGKNNGSVNEEIYFVCKEKHGIFVKKAQVRLDRSAPRVDSTPKSNAADVSSKHFTPAVSRKSPQSSSVEYNVGDGVKIGSKEGVIKFIGATKFADGIWYGVELDSSAGKNNGSVNGVAYFDCKEKYGLFVKKSQLRSNSKRTSASRKVTVGTKEGSPAVKTPESISGESPILKLPPTLPPPPLVLDPPTAQVDDKTGTKAVEEPPPPLILVPPTAQHDDKAGPKAIEEPPPNAPATIPPVATTPDGRVAVKSLVGESLTEKDKLREHVLSDEKDNEIKKLKSQLVHDANEKDVRIQTLSLQLDQSYIDKEDEIKRIKTMLKQAMIEKDNEIKSAKSMLDQVRKNGSLKADSMKKDAEAIAAAEIAALKRALEHSNEESKASTESLKAQLETGNATRESAEAIANKLQEEVLDITKKHDQLKVELNKERAKKDLTAETVAKAKALTLRWERKCSELQKEIEDLNETVEMLTIDKEQLQEERDLAEELSEELQAEVGRLQVEVDTAGVGIHRAGPGDEGSAEGGGILELRLQNEKLREALLRLRDSSSLEKKEALKVSKEMQKELVALRTAEQSAKKAAERNRQLEVEMEELKEMVDTAQAYEEMVEELTEKNLELSDRVIDMEGTIEELEQLQEVSEEVEAQQKEFVDQLNQEIHLKDTKLISLKKDLKKHELLSVGKDATIARFRGAVQSLKEELNLANETIESMENDITHKNSEADITRSRSLESQTLSRRLMQSTADLKMEKLEAFLKQMSIDHFGKLIPESISESSRDMVSCHTLLAAIDGKAQVVIDILLPIMRKQESKVDETSHYVLRFLFDFQAFMRSMYLILASRSDDVAVDFQRLAQRLLPAQRQANQALSEVFFFIRSEGSSPLRSSTEYIHLMAAHKSMSGMCTKVLFAENNDINKELETCARAIEVEMVHAQARAYECLFPWVLSVLRNTEGNDSGQNESVETEVETTLTGTFGSMVKTIRALGSLRFENLDREDLVQIRKMMAPCAPHLLTLIDCIEEATGELEDAENPKLHPKALEISTLLHKNVESLSTMIPLGHAIGQTYTRDVFEYKNLPTLDEIVVQTHERLSAAKSLEHSIKEVKATLSKRIKEVYSTQKKLDASLLQQKLLEKKITDSRVLLEEKEKQRVTIQADFEKEQLNFESAIGEVHKVVENLQRDNRRLKKRTDMPSVGSPSAPAQTGVSGRSSSTPEALHCAVKESRRWRKLFFDEKLRSASVASLSLKIPTAHAEKIRSFTRHLTTVKSNIRLRQSNRRLLDLSTQKLTGETIHQLKASEAELISAFDKCKQEITHFVAKNFSPASMNGLNFVEVC